MPRFVSDSACLLPRRDGLLVAVLVPACVRALDTMRWPESPHYDGCCRWSSESGQGTAQEMSSPATDVARVEDDGKSVSLIVIPVSEPPW